MATVMYDKQVDIDSANLRPITFPGKPKETQILSRENNGAAAAALSPFPIWRTHVQVFMVSTGDDPGSESEIRGFVKFQNNNESTFSKDLPNETFFNKENGGLGRRLIDTHIDTAFMPANFRAYTKEDDLFGQNIIMDKRMDWSILSNMEKYNDAKPHVEEWHNNKDIAYRANLWVQITKLS